MSKTNLIIDNNNFTYKAISVYKGVRGKKLFNLEGERKEFLELLATNFLYELNRFKKCINRVIFVKDTAPSWRYRVLKEYKAGRIKDENVHWQNYYILVTEFCAELEKKGVIICSATNAEGDDLMFFLDMLFKNINENCIFLTSDRDITQLVRCDKSGYTIIYDNTNKKLFCESNFVQDYVEQKSVHLDSMFSISSFIHEDKTDDSTKEVFNTIFKRGIDFIETSGFEVILDKMLTGDKSDKVPSAIVVEKGGKNYGIGEKTAERIIEEMYRTEHKMSKDDLLTDSFREKVSSTTMELLKGFVRTVATPEVIQEGLKRNSTLMLLHENVIPEDVMENMKVSVTHKIDVYTEEFKNFSSMEDVLGGLIKKSKIVFNKV